MIHVIHFLHSLWAYRNTAWLGIVLVLGSSSIRAQGLVKGLGLDSDSIPLQRRSYVLERIVVEGLRLHPQAPLARKRLSSTELKNAHHGQNLSFLLAQNTPSLHTASESGTAFGNYARIFVRGMDQSRLNISLNGAPLNDMLDQVFYSSNIADLSANLSSIEVQRGLGSTAYGLASYAGSVNMEGILPSVQSAGGLAETDIGSFGSWRLSGAVNSGLKPNGWAVSARLSHLQSEGYRTHSGTVASSGFFSASHRRKRSLWQITAISGRTQNELAYAIIPRATLDQNPKANTIDPKETDHYTQSLVVVERKDSLSARHSLAVGLYYHHAGGVFPYGYNDGTNYQAIEYGLRNRHIGYRKSWHYRGYGDRMGLLVELHAYGFFRRNTEASRPSVSTFYYRDATHKYEASLHTKYYSTIGSLRVFAEAQLRYIQLWLIPRIGNDNLSKIGREWLFFNPTIGISYALNDQHELYASFGRALREPTRNDLLGDTNLNSGTRAALESNESPTPEQVLDLEVGTRSSGNGWRWGVNVFYMRFRDEITPIGRFITDYYAQLRKNVPHSYRSGIEVETSAQLMRHIELSGHITWMQARIETYAPQDGVAYENVWPVMTPAWSWFVRLHYQPQRRWDTSINARYIGSAYIEPSNQSDWAIPAAWTLNWRFSARIRKGYQVRLQANNLLNRTYYGYGALLDPNTAGYLPQAPRNWRISLRYEW